MRFFVPDYIDKELIKCLDRNVSDVWTNNNLYKAKKVVMDQVEVGKTYELFTLKSPHSYLLRVWRKEDYMVWDENGAQYNLKFYEIYQVV